MQPVVANKALLPMSNKLILAKIRERMGARRHGDFAAADRLRDDLAAHGVTLQDRRDFDGTRWTLSSANGRVDLTDDSHVA